MPGSRQQSHLQPFTETSEVPSLARHAQGLGSGGWEQGLTATPAIWGQRRPAPIGLRVAVWLAALLVAIGVAALIVDKAKPQWLNSLRANQSSTLPSSNSNSGTSSSISHNGPGSGNRRAGPGQVKVSSTGDTSSTVSVGASSYKVLVSAEEPCWVEVTSPSQLNPLFAQVMQSGDHQSFDSSEGQLTVQLGSSTVKVQVKMNGTLANWTFSPTVVPFVLNFGTA